MEEEGRADRAAGAAQERAEWSWEDRRVTRGRGRPCIWTGGVGGGQEQLAARRLEHSSGRAYSRSLSLYSHLLQPSLLRMPPPRPAPVVIASAAVLAVAGAAALTVVKRPPPPALTPRPKKAVAESSVSYSCKIVSIVSLTTPGRSSSPQLSLHTRREVNTPAVVSQGRRKPLDLLN